MPRTELEDSLGEALFVRNTRNIQLTDFGMNFLPRVQQLLHESEMLFSTRSAQDDMRGMVRITLPKLTHNAAILSKLLTRCEGYPELVIDWRVDTARLDSVTHQIDMGVRIGPQPDDMVIARKICDYTDAARRPEEPGGAAGSLSCQQPDQRRDKPVLGLALS